MAELKNTIVNGILNINGDLIASSIKKRGGTSTQFLMADGSEKTLSATDITAALEYTPPTADTGATSVTVTGFGNAVTAANYNATNRTLTLAKGSTFLTTIPTATSGTQAVLGGVKIGANLTISDGFLSLSATNVTNALGYTPSSATVNNAKITIAAGNGLTGGGDFTLNQASAATVTLKVGAGNGITVAADTVAAKPGSGITVDSTGINHYTPTTVASNVAAASRTYVKSITFDSFGHVTGVSTGTETVTNTDTKVKNELATTTKGYLTATTSTTTTTGTQIFDTGVYLDNVAGQLVASTFKGNKLQAGNGAVTMEYDSSYKAVKFVFA